MDTTDVGEAAQSAMRQSKSLVSRQVEQRAHQLGAQIGSVAEDLRGVSLQLRQNDTLGVAATYVDRGAELVDSFARYLRRTDADHLMRDAESIARSQPWAFAAGSMVAGFAAARFLKASSARRYRENASREEYRYAT
jgi:hypothetical protein